MPTQKYNIKLKINNKTQLKQNGSPTKKAKIRILSTTIPRSIRRSEVESTQVHTLLHQTCQRKEIPTHQSFHQVRIPRHQINTPKKD